MNIGVEQSLLKLRPSKFNIRYSIFPILFILLFSSCKDIRKEYFSNGELKQQLSYRNNVLHGQCVWYFENGKKMMECTYVNGNIEGQVNRWYFTGKPESTGNYSKNRKEGKNIRYYESGAVMTEENYKNDTLDGVFTENFESGQIKSKGSFSMGLWNGRWEYYDSKGLLVGEGNFINGTGVLKGYYWNGRLKRTVNFANNQKHGTETWFKEDGLLEKELLYDHDKLVTENN